MPTRVVGGRQRAGTAAPAPAPWPWQRLTGLSPRHQSRLNVLERLHVRSLLLHALGRLGLAFRAHHHRAAGSGGAGDGRIALLLDRRRAAGHRRAGETEGGLHVALRLRGWPSAVAMRRSATIDSSSVARGGRGRPPGWTRVQNGLGSPHETPWFRSSSADHSSASPVVGAACTQALGRRCGARASGAHSLGVFRL